MAKLSVDKVLPGMELAALEPGSTPLEAIVLIKFMDPEGNLSWAQRETQGLDRADIIGALQMEIDRRRYDAVRSWYDNEGDG